MNIEYYSFQFLDLHLRLLLQFLFIKHYIIMLCLNLLMNDQKRHVTLLVRLSDQKKTSTFVNSRSCPLETT